MARRVLVVESDVASGERARAELEGEGFAVAVASSAGGALDQVRLQQPDVIVAGAEPAALAREVEALLRDEPGGPEIPLVVLGSGSDLREVALAASATGERRAFARLAEQDERRRQFMKNLAHELAGPLTPIAGYLRILQSEKLGPLDPRQRRVLETMHHSMLRLTRIVENLADFATLGPGDARLHEEPFDADRLADEVVEEQRGAIRDGRLHAAVLHAGAPPVVADGRKLRQALGNLVGNAVKFSPHGGEVLVEVSVGAGRLRYAVYDQGPGVAGGDAETIFEPLHHAGRRGVDDTHAPGSGLGLPVARRIAEAHGGRVWVESPPRRQPPSAIRAFGGSRFVLEIPVRLADRPAEGHGAPA